jgi:fructose-bisphosphate aldolase class I
MEELIQTASLLMDPKKGLLAMDESTGTCNKRFAALGIPQTEEARRDWRELIINTPDLGSFVSGAILFDETIRQIKKDGISMVKGLQNMGIIPGIKVDLGAVPMAGHNGEKITEGLDGLRERLQEYYKLGARFAKWRAVVSMTKDIPSWGCIQANASSLALYAALCQEAGLVPIVEPEILMDGDHNLDRSYSVTEQVLRSVFTHLYQQKVRLDGMILKPGMVHPGLKNSALISPSQIAKGTVNCFLNSVPASVAGIAFLSGGQSGVEASENLNAMHTQFPNLPWPLTFSFSRAIQQPALEIWQGKDSNIIESQKALLHRASCNAAARQGLYKPEMEK